MRPTKAVLVVTSILGYPIPRILDLHLQIGARRNPSEERASAACVAYQDRWIAGSTRGDFRPDAAPAHCFSRRDHFLDRIAVLICQVQRAALASSPKVVKCPHVRLRNVAYVNVVANTGAIRGLVIIAKNANGSACARGSKHQGNQVSFGIVGLTNLTVRVRARGIEI